MTRPRLLDLFCGAGGASVGYARAGFEVIGVDLAPQPRYPFPFVQADALDVLTDTAYLDTFDVVHASPPCQGYSGMSRTRPGLADTYPRLIEPVRRQLSDRVYVMENVPGARQHMREPLTLCGAMFGLRLYRHRLFETNAAAWQPHHPPHVIPASRAGHYVPGTVMSVAGNCAPIALAREAMGIDWMTRAELAESIPPAFTEYIGEQVMAALAVTA